MEAKGLDAAAKAVTAVDLESGEELRLEYDKLVIATGARPVMPNIPGIDLPGVFALRNPSDADAVLEAVNAGMKRAVIVGGGRALTRTSPTTWRTSSRTTASPSSSATA